MRTSKDIFEGILDTDDNDLKRINRQLKLIQDIEKLSRFILKNQESDSDYKKDIFGNTLKEGDVVLFIDYYARNISLTNIIKELSDTELSFALNIEDKFSSGPSYIINNKRYICTAGDCLIKIHDPNKLLRTKKL